MRQVVNLFDALASGVPWTFMMNTLLVLMALASCDAAGGDDSVASFQHQHGIDFKPWSPEFTVTCIRRKALVSDEKNIGLKGVV